jgi:hypothetical protein
MQWPPDYIEALNRRSSIMKQARGDKTFARKLKKHYRNNTKAFIHDWGMTFDPRAKPPLPRKMPFIMFPKQHDMVDFIDDCLEHGEPGLIEKSRDMGATWTCVEYSVAKFLFNPGTSVGWGSRKQELVDRMGDPSSIFEKMRMQFRATPKFLLPVGFSEKDHLNYMKCINPENGSSITGESGDNIGRGGRTTIYFKDESGHYERPELIEAALGDNTDVQIDISSVNGTANVFYRRRMAGEIWMPGEQMDPGKIRVFIMDWRDHPAKDQAWYDRRHRLAEDSGLLHLLAQEVDRDYTSSVEGIIIPPKWVKSAIDAHIKLGIEDDGIVMAALDVADEGGDKNALGIRKGIVLNHIEAWGEGDTGVTANRALTDCKMHGVTHLFYDCIGVGAGVKAETNRLDREGAIPKTLSIHQWNAADNPINPSDHVIEFDRDSPINKDFYLNMKSQGWWELRRRFERTHRAVTQGIVYDADKMISLPSSLANLHAVVTELSQPTYSHNGKGKLLVDKKPDGSRSPNMADSIMMLYHPSEMNEGFRMVVI